MAYPFKKYNYNILIDGFKQADCSEVSAADTEAEPIEYREGKTKCKKVVIRLMDDNNIESKAEWVLENAWPTKYTVPNLNENADEVSFESIELCHEGLTRTK